MKKTSSRVPDHTAKFVEVFLSNGENATRAYLAIKPHVTEGTAAVEGHRLLVKPKTQQLLAKRRNELLTRYALNAERHYAELSGISYFNPKELVDEQGNPKPLRELPDRVAAALEVIVESGQVKYRPYSKTTALEQSSKILRLTDRPPPPPPDPEGEEAVDLHDVAKRLAFMLYTADKEERDKASSPKQLPKPKKKLATEA